MAELGHSPHEQKSLRRLFGVSGQAVRKWADGLSMPTASRMPQVANILGVRRAWLQDGELPMRPVVGLKEGSSKRSAEISLTEREARLLTLYRRLIPEQQKAVDLVMKSLAETSGK